MREGGPLARDKDTQLHSLFSEALELLRVYPRFIPGVFACLFRSGKMRFCICR